MRTASQLVQILLGEAMTKAEVLNLFPAPERVWNVPFNSDQTLSYQDVYVLLIDRNHPHYDQFFMACSKASYRPVSAGEPYLLFFMDRQPTLDERGFRQIPITAVSTSFILAYPQGCPLAINLMGSHSFVVFVHDKVVELKDWVASVA